MDSPSLRHNSALGDSPQEEIKKQTNVALVRENDVKQLKVDEANNKSRLKDKIPSDKKSSKKTSKGEKKNSKTLKKKKKKEKIEIDENTPYREKKTSNSGKRSRAVTTAIDVVDNPGKIKSDTINRQVPGESAPMHSGSVVESSVAKVPHITAEGAENIDGTKEVESAKSHHKGKPPQNKKSSKSSSGISKNTDTKTSITGKDNPRNDELTTINDDRKDAAGMKNKNLTPRGKGGEKVHISNCNVVLPSISHAAQHHEEDPEVTKVVERTEAKVVHSEQELQINTRKDKLKEQIKNISPVKQDGEQVKPKEDLKKVSDAAKSHGKTPHGVSRNAIAKTSLSQKASPRDCMASNQVRTVVDSIKIDKIIPQSKERRRVPIPDIEFVHRSRQEGKEPKVTEDGTKEVPFVSQKEEEQKAMKGNTDEVEAEEEERVGQAKKKVAPVGQGLQTINVGKDEAKKENKKTRGVSLVSEDEDKLVQAKEGKTQVVNSKISHQKETIPSHKDSSTATLRSERDTTDDEEVNQKMLHKAIAVNDNTNDTGKMKQDTVLPRGRKGGEHSHSPKGNVVVRSISNATQAAEEPEVTKGMIDGNDAREKKRTEHAKEEYEGSEQRLQTRVTRDTSENENIKKKANSIKLRHEEENLLDQMKSDRTENNVEPPPTKQTSQKLKVKEDIERTKTDNSNTHHKEGAGLPLLKEDTMLSLNPSEPEVESEVEEGMITDVDTEEEEEEESMLSEEDHGELEPQNNINIRKDKPKEEVNTRTDVVMVTHSDEEQDVGRRTMVTNSKKPSYKVKTTLDKKASNKTPHGGKNDTNSKLTSDRKKKQSSDEKQNEKKLPLLDRTPGAADPKINRNNRNKIIPSNKANREVAERREKAEQAKEELARAEHALQIIKLRKELMDATVMRNLKRLLATTQLVRDKNYQPAMMDEMIKAKSMIARLQHIRKLWHAVLELDHNTVAEVKGYAAPPPAVSKVLSATLLILGHYVEETKEWPKVQNILNKTGKQSLLQRVARFDINNVDPGIAMGAKEILKDLTLEQIRVVSAGAATFYVWTKGLINEIETRLGEDIMNTRPRTRRPRRTWGLSRPLAKFNKLSTLISVDL